MSEKNESSAFEIPDAPEESTGQNDNILIGEDISHELDERKRNFEAEIPRKRDKNQNNRNTETDLSLTEVKAKKNETDSDENSYPVSTDLNQEISGIKSFESVEDEMSAGDMPSLPEEIPVTVPVEKIRSRAKNSEEKKMDENDFLSDPRSESGITDDDTISFLGKKKSDPNDQLSTDQLIAQATHKHGNSPDGHMASAIPEGSLDGIKIKSGPGIITTMGILIAIITSATALILSLPSDGEKASNLSSDHESKIISNNDKIASLEQKIESLQNEISKMSEKYGQTNGPKKKPIKKKIVKRKKPSKGKDTKKSKLKKAHSRKNPVKSARKKTIRKKSSKTSRKKHVRKSGKPIRKKPVRKKSVKKISKR